jgi:hypothetical protein
VCHAYLVSNRSQDLQRNPHTSWYGPANALSNKSCDCFDQPMQCRSYRHKRTSHRLLSFTPPTGTLIGLNVVGILQAQVNKYMYTPSSLSLSLVPTPRSSQPTIRRAIPTAIASNPTTMKLAAFSFLFALVASVVALPAESASSRVRRQDDCTVCQQYCDTTEDPSACKSENCADMVRRLLLNDCISLSVADIGISAEHDGR